MTKIFRVRPNTLSDESAVYDVVAGSEAASIVIASPPSARVADDLAFSLNRIADLYLNAGSERAARQLTHDLHYRIDTLLPRL